MPSKLPGLGDAVPVADALRERVVAERGADLGRRPDERQALVPVGVGVLRARDAAAVEPHLAVEVVEHVAGHRGVPVLARDDDAIAYARASSALS